jgi:hypothetical protein
MARVSEDRALSVRQPWAWALMVGLKPVENRTWATNHRGRLWIHASTRWDRSRPDLLAKAAAGGPLVTGALLGHADLLAIHRSDDCGDSCSEWAVPGNYHWQLASPVPLAEPVPMQGRLGLWVPPILPR